MIKDYITYISIGVVTYSQNREHPQQHKIQQERSGFSRPPADVPHNGQIQPETKKQGLSRCSPCKLLPREQNRMAKRFGGANGEYVTQKGTPCDSHPAYTDTWFI